MGSINNAHINTWAMAFCNPWFAAAPP